MLNLKFVKLQTKHASIASYLRQTDIDEVTAMTGLSPEVAVAYSIAHTERGFAVELDGRPVVLFGVSGDMIWCVGTDDVTQHPITFYRMSKKVIPMLKEGHTYLENYVDERNKLYLKWLKWAGFHIDEPIRIGNGFFHKIWWRKES